MAAVRGPGQEGDPSTSNTLKLHAAFCSYIPHLQDTSTPKGGKDFNNNHRNLVISEFQMKQQPHTIIAVSTGEADTRRDPFGDQAMEATGEWPGRERTCAQPDEGLHGSRRRRINIYNEENTRSDSAVQQYQSLHTWLTVSKGPHARSTGSSDKQRPEQMHTAASTALLRHSSADGASAWELWRWNKSTREDRVTEKPKNKTIYEANIRICVFVAHLEQVHCEIKVLHWHR